ncbi:MAG TPA: uroporphyrinogen decarboxylase family protein [Candidatus Brocadiia bacterium]|nr:uroporphyrinogen decarboxylase family protein [Candidatus Brocadiia bacterium]
MPLTRRENFLRNVRFQGPEYTPCRVVINMASWDLWREKMEEVVLRHPILFPSYRKGQMNFNNLTFAPGYRKDEDFVDAWGCTWRSTVNGIEGVVIGSPLEDWAKLETWQAPDGLKTADRGPIDWDAIRKATAAAKARGDLTSGSLPHGFFFMRLTYLRGFENLLTDLIEEPPQLARLIEQIDRHNIAVVQQYIDMGVDVMELGEDLGTQTSSVISPAMFKKFCVPSYKRLTEPIKAAGIIVSLHSDGYILDLMDEFASCGMDIVNPQDLVNGIDNIARVCKNRFCIRLDVDRQKIVPFGTRKEIEDLIAEGVRKLGSPRGGLELICGIYPPTPPENVDAVCCAMEKYRTWWFDGRGRE